MSATSRFLLDPAPGGLALVQDLVNTRPVPAYGVRDLLATVADADRWVRTAVPPWRELAGVTGSPGPLRAADLTGLRRLRHDVEDVLAGGDAEVRARSGVVAGHGGLRLEPTGSGAGWVASAVLGQLLLSQVDGSLPRLKVCRLEACPCAFFDRSRNNSRVWHDVRTCGNLTNLRASRARRRAG